MPKGRYLLSSIIFGNDPTVNDSTFLVNPAFNVMKNQTVALDARQAKPVSVSVPRHEAKGFFHDVGFSAASANGGFGSDLLLFGGLEGTYTAQLGNQKPVPGFVGQVFNMFAEPGKDATFTDSKVAYTLYWYEKGKFFTGFTRKVGQSDLATVREDFAKHADGGLGERLTFPVSPVPASPWSTTLLSSLPFHRTAYFNTNGGVAWDHVFFEDVPGTDPQFPFPETISSQSKPTVTYQGGKTYVEQWNWGVFGPAFPPPTYPSDWVTRTGDEIFVALPLYSDGGGHAGFSAVDNAKTTLFRNGKKVGEFDDYFADFPVPAGKARYRLQVQADRGAPFSLSTRITTAWTFPSGHVNPETFTPLSLSAVRFTPALDANNAAPGGRKFTLPIAMQRQTGAPAATTKSLTVEVSYDDGSHWKTVTLSGYGEKWTAELTHPNKAGFVSLRAKATDTSGNTVEQTIIRAYRITA